jgi:uncharacterized membrane protein YsdA (DUF1294 family)
MLKLPTLSERPAGENESMTKLYYRKRAQISSVVLWLLVTAVLTVALWLVTNWAIYPVWLVCASVTTAVAYALDKARAAAGSNQRIPESSLHLFSLLGGFVGGAFGLLVLRHKSNFSRHPLFPIIVVVSAVAHGLVLWFLR